jgi:hypothetical protein
MGAEDEEYEANQLQMVGEQNQKASASVVRGTLLELLQSLGRTMQ